MVREVVFGANDGLVSSVALVAGVAASTGDSRVVVLGGIAGLVAGSISMSLGAYVSTKSEREFREAEEARERWEVINMREQEIAETRHIFRLKGITGPLLDEVVTEVSRNDESWVSLMMTEELGFPDHAPRPTLAAVLMGLSFAAAASFPVAPYLFFDGTTALVVSLAATAAALFSVGAWRARLSQGRVWIKAAEMVLLAGVAVGAAYVIGNLVGNLLP